MCFKVPELAREQTDWWLMHSEASKVESSILDQRDHYRMDPVEIFAVAAGGESLRLKNGAGGFCPPESWFYIPWPQLIRDNRENSEGVRFKHKLSCLEGFAALEALTMVPDKIRNGEATIYCDNAGFVGMY